MVISEKKFDNSKLLEYGFKLCDDKYIYNKNIINNKFNLLIEIFLNSIEYKVFDNSNNEEYIMAYLEDTNGEYVGKVKEIVEKTLNEIVDKCCDNKTFDQSLTKDVIDYLNKKYNDSLEFLWDKFPNVGVVRNKKNNKWYGIIFKIEERKIGLDSDNLVEILNVRYDKENIEKVIDNKHIFPAYHMNKKSWITIKLNNDIKKDYIFNLIDESYKLSLNK